MLRMSALKTGGAYSLRGLVMGSLMFCCRTVIVLHPEGWYWILWCLISSEVAQAMDRASLQVVQNEEGGSQRCAASAWRDEPRGALWIQQREVPGSFFLTAVKHLGRLCICRSGRDPGQLYLAQILFSFIVICCSTFLPPHPFCWTCNRLGRQKYLAFDPFMMSWNAFRKPLTIPDGHSETSRTLLTERTLLTICV